MRSYYKLEFLFIIYCSRVGFHFLCFQELSLGVNTLFSLEKGSSLRES